jgi:hypothetical protein
MIGLYVDRRCADQPRYSFGPPRDALMRIPEDLLNATVFLGGKDGRGDRHYRGTAVCVSLPIEDQTMRTACPCLVTAKHNIVKAMATYGNVCVRVNSGDAGAVDIDINEPWTYSDNAASDIAVIPFPALLGYGTLLLPLPTSWFATSEIIASRGIGPGDDLVVMGLFASHVGTRRNLPIVRSGNIASMPQESLIDPKTGGEYDAYLAEVRSIGGLSGSPVFTTLYPATRPTVDDKDSSGLAFYLLGVIRGHWRADPEMDYGDDFDLSEAEQLNTGVAIVTPITDAVPILEKEPFVAYRKEMEKALAARSGQVEDSAIADEGDESSEFENFDALVSKLVQVPKSEIDEQRAKK